MLDPTALFVSAVVVFGCSSDAEGAPIAPRSGITMICEEPGAARALETRLAAIRAHADPDVRPALAFDGR